MGIQILCGFDADFMGEMQETGLSYYLLFILFVLIGSLTIMNMLIGIVCEVVSAVADAEKDANALLACEAHVSELAVWLDPDRSESISREEFEQVLIQPH